MLEIGYMHRKYILFLSLVSLLFSPIAYNKAATLYVSPSGTGAGAGTSWTNSATWANALAAANPYDTILFTNGTYNHNIFITKNALRLRSYNKWGAKILGASGNHSITALDANVSNVIDGFWVYKPWLTGIKFNGSYSSVSNCIVEEAGHGNPAWVTNNTGTFTGQGLEMHNVLGSWITHNYFYKGGARVNLDHGMYVNGTNLVIAYNVAISNLCWGYQLYDGSGDNHNIQFFGNYAAGNGGVPGSPGGGIVMYTYGAKSNYFFNNTIYSYRDGFYHNANGAAGRSFCTNNIFFGESGYVSAFGSAAGVMTGGYNWQNQLNTFAGALTNITDKYTITNNYLAFFPDYGSGRFWLRSDSGALGNGLLSANPPYNFWGQPYTRADIGAAEFSMAHTFDTRNLITDTTPDWWLLLLLGVPPLPSFPAEVDLGTIPSDYFLDCRPTYLPN